MTIEYVEEEPVASPVRLFEITNGSAFALEDVVYLARHRNWDNTLECFSFSGRESIDLNTFVTPVEVLKVSYRRKV